MEGKEIIISTLCLVFLAHYVFTASVSTHLPSTTVAHTTIAHTTRRHHHGHRPTHSTEHSERAHLIFHLDDHSIEKMLVAKEIITNSTDICYAYPLVDKEMELVRKPLELIKIENHVMHQILSKAYYSWSYDDLSVRSGYFSRFCNHTVIYRVHRV